MIFKYIDWHMRKACIIICIAFLLLSCSDGQGGKINQPYDGGHGIGIDTETVKQIQQYEDSIRVLEQK